jgi:hypothetical protein
VLTTVASTDSATSSSVQLPRMTCWASLNAYTPGRSSVIAPPSAWPALIVWPGLIVWAARMVWPALGVDPPLRTGHGNPAADRLSAAADSAADSSAAAWAGMSGA